MANPNAIVSGVVRIDPPLERVTVEMLRAAPEISVELQNGRRVRLDAADPRSVGFAQVLDGLMKQRLPVYLEVDPVTSTISRLLIPFLTRVLRVRPTGNDALDVELEYSHGRHTLRRNQAEFADFERLLQDCVRSTSPVILTEDDAHDIIDVRIFEPTPDGPLPPFPSGKFPPPNPRPRGLLWRLLDRIWLWRWWPWWWFCCLSPARAQQVFDAMKATSCVPLTVPPPCIPFLYPDDGCWGRAHEMCRLMINVGLSPKKVWIKAGTRLHVNTRNSPNCFVEWGWHVAPTLCVRGPYFFQTQSIVIDPSLFITPVSKATWKNAQGDSSATLTDSASSVFYLWNGTTDPIYAQTNQVLATYRLRLQARSIQFGPPPYAACP